MKRFWLCSAGLLFLTACASLTPTPSASVATAPVTATETATLLSTAIPTIAVTETPAPTAPLVDAAEQFKKVEQLLREYKPPETSPTALHEALAQAALDFLRERADPNTSLEGQSSIAQLQAALRDLPGLAQQPLKVEPHVVAIHLRDSEGGSQDLALISFENMAGLPIVALHRLGASYEAIPVSVFIGDVDPRNNFSSAIVRGLDLTGDGIGEAIYTYTVGGASGSTTVLNVERWLPDSKELKTIFRASLITWAGASSYELIPAEKGQNIKLTFPWFGVFDHKLLEHPQATQIWGYDEALDSFVKQAENIEPAANTLQQLNSAEAMFRQGEFEKASAGYERAWNDRSLKNAELGEASTDIRGFARFREAEVLALLGRESEAKQALSDVQKRGGDLGKLAAAFLKNYKGADSAIHAWAGLESGIDLYNIIYHDDIPSNLAFPLDASAVYFKGEIVAAYLDAHPDASSQPETVFQEVRALGLETLTRGAADLDGDGTNEFLLVTQAGGASPNKLQELWLVHRGAARWLAREIYSIERVALESSIVPLPGGKGNAIRLNLPNSSPMQIALTWNGTRVIFLDAVSLAPSNDSDQWPVVGGGPTE